jgi:6-hydroxy-3-succinoylpyridine 3-monooxygenase
MPVQQQKPLRTRIYIDGYNLYYGCLKNTSLKWLDIKVLFETQILPSILFTKDGTTATFELLSPSIKYFTAQILEKAAKATDSVACQSRYHDALRKKYINEIEIVEGYYSAVPSNASVIDENDPDKDPRDCQSIKVWKLEEKQSDVNLALQAYHDAITGVVDHIVIVTNDTDISPAMKLIREHTNVILGLVIPTKNHERRPNAELKEYAHWTRTHITEAELLASQLPRVIPHGRHPVSKPDTWYPHQPIFQKIMELGIPVRGNKGSFYKWMSQPNPYLENQIPIDMIETEVGANAVLAYMQKYDADKAKENGL